MATWAQLRTIVRALPETAEVSPHNWRVKGKLLAWERPLRRSDLEALGPSAPKGDILGVWVPDLDVKDALVGGKPRIYFTTPHFDGYAAVLVRLAVIGVAELRELVENAWLHRAPVRVKNAWLEQSPAKSHEKTANAKTSAKTNARAATSPRRR